MWCTFRSDFHPAGALNFTGMFPPDSRNLGGRHALLCEHAIHQIKLQHIKRGKSPRPPAKTKDDLNRVHKLNGTVRKLSFQDSQHSQRGFGKVSSHLDYVQQVS
jgi:hypothetical protein